MCVPLVFPDPPAHLTSSTLHRLKERLRCLQLPPASRRGGDAATAGRERRATRAYDNRSITCTRSDLTVTVRRGCGLCVCGLEHGRARAVYNNNSERAQARMWYMMIG